MERKKAIPCGLFIYTLILFNFSLNLNEVIGFESRLYLFALEMWRHGPNWFLSLYQKPYPDYMVTSTYFIYVFSKLMNELTRFTAIFPSTLVSALTVVITYLIGAKRSQSWGFSAACFLLLTYTFVTEARTISIDQYIALITALCFYFLLNNNVWILYLLLILGFALRGPIGLIVPTAVVCSYYLTDYKIKSSIIFAMNALLILSALFICFYTLAYYVNGANFAKLIITQHATARFQTYYALKWDFYWTESIGAYALSYIVSIFVLLGLKYANPSDRQFIVKLMAWILIVLIGLSIPSIKKVRYLLPIAPALALMCGYIFTVNPSIKYYYGLQRILHTLFLFFPVTFICLFSIIKLTHPEFVFYNGLIYSFYSLCQIFLIHMHRSHLKIKHLIALFVASLTFVFTYIMIIEPINFQLNQTKTFVQSVETMRSKENAKLAFYHENPDGSVIKYLANLEKEEIPLFFTEPHQLLQSEISMLYLTSKEYFAKLPIEIQNKLSIVKSGKIGRDDYIVFTKATFDNSTLADTSST